jgi:hypothetical protein
VLANRKYYRHYDVVVFNTPSPRECFQYFIINDYDLDAADTIKKKKNKFVVVVLMCVGTKALVSTCTGCNTRTLYPFYYHERTEHLSVNDLFSCKHVYPTVSKLRFDLGLAINSAAENYDQLLYNLLCEKLIEVDYRNMLQPGNWYMKDAILHTTEKGKLSIYLTECLQLLIVSEQRTTNGRRLFHCYECPRSVGCRHTSLIANEFVHDLDDLPDLNGIV